MENHNIRISFQSATGVNIGNQETIPRNDFCPNDVLLVSRTKLENYYKRTNAYMRSFFKQKKGMLRMNDLPIKEYYVETNLREMDIRDGIGEYTSLKDIFMNKHKHKTILLIGDPGYGKTTLCKKIAYDWASENESASYLNHFYFVVIVDLRELNGKSIYEMVMNNIFENVKKVKNRPKLPEANSNILVILDGFEEFSDIESVTDFLNEDSVEISPKMTILIASRPQNVGLITKSIDRKFHIEGFSQEQKEEYIKLLYRGKNGYYTNLIELVEQNNFLNNIAECPLMLNIICSLYQTEGIKAIQRLTDLYIRMLFTMAKTFTNKQPEEFLRNMTEWKYFCGENLLVNLVKTFPYPLNRRNQITTMAVKESFNHEYEHEYIIGLNILCKSSSYQDRNAYYDMVHETFHEFLSALSVRIEHGDYPYLSNYTLLFILGLFDEDKLPSFEKQHFNHVVFDDKFSKQLRTELKDENWKAFLVLLNSIAPDCVEYLEN